MRVTIALLGVLLLLVACGQTAPQTADTTTANTETANTSTTSDAKDALQEIFMDMESLEYKATYDITTTMDGKTERGTMSQFMAGERMRIDFAAQGTEVRTYVLPDEYITCFNQGSWACTSLDTAEDGDTPEIIDDEIRTEVEGESEEFDVAALPDRTIAGQRATCFRIAYADGSAEYCFSKEGVPLYTKSSSPDGTSEMIATSYSTNVGGSDFTPPATPKPMFDPSSMPAYDPDLYGEYDPSAGLEEY